MILLAALGYLVLAAALGLAPIRWGLPAVAALAFLGAWLATAGICGADFPFHLNQDGRCSASDQPSEVFGSLLAIAVILGMLGLLAGRVLRSFRR